MTDCKQAIRARAIELGFDAVGFARAETTAEEQGNLETYLAEGRHGAMAWMQRTAERRANPRVLWPAARSVISLGLNYGPSEDPLAVLDEPDRGAISVYARGCDYHDVAKKRLKALGRWIAETYGCEVKVFVDTAPVMEKPLAQRAGLGWIGKHTNLVSRRFGSWLFLAEVLTTLELTPDEPETDHCGTCDACVRACPTGALEPYRIEPRRCLSYVSIEHPGEIPAELAACLGNRIYGCDDCLAACPWNKFSEPTPHAEFRPRSALAAPKLTELAQLDDAQFRTRFAGSAIKRIGRDRFVRTVEAAIGNRLRAVRPFPNVSAQPTLARDPERGEPFLASVP